MSDKELDDLFREAADGFKIQEDPSAWPKMSALLDEAGRVPSFWNWKTITGFTIAGLTGVSVWWYSTNGSFESDFQNQGIVNTQNVNKAGEKKELSSETMNETTRQSTNRGETIKKDRLIQSENDESSGINKNGKNKNTETEEDRIQSPAAPRVTYKVKSNSQVTVKPEEVSAIRNVYLSDKENEQELVLPGQPTQPVNDGTELSNVSLYNGSEDRTLTKVLVDSLQKDSSSVVTKIEMLSVKDSIGKPELSEKNTPGRHKVSIMISVSPDFSSIKYFTPDKSGINYGIQIGYNFNSRWSIFTGAISSRKIYTSTEIEKSYTSPKGYDYPVMKLTGDCRVLDIPLNVYYTFHPGHSISFKAGLGISSYIMFSEDYTYIVDNPYGSGVYSQRIDNENNEWFKMANVSLTIQKRLRERFYVEFEPFLKTPLGGIGEGNVSLVSLGAFLNLRYDIF